jgi:hypothetical protein
VQFAYEATLESSTELALIDQFLAGARVNPFARAALEMLNDDLVYVVTSTIKTNKVSVVAKDSNKQSLGIDLPVIQNAIGANVKVGGNQSGTGLVTYEGALPLVFGFQAVQLIFDQGKYRRMKLIDAGKISAEAVEEDISAEAVEDDTPVYLDVNTLLRN